MSLRTEKLTADGAKFAAEMEQAAGEPVRDQGTWTHLTEDIAKVSTKRVNQNQVRGKSNTYIPTRH